MDKLNQQLNFILELDKLKGIYRQNVVPSDHLRRENSAEHSWHAAMVALIFQEYTQEKIDINRVVKMLLIHDVVEIYAGDTFAYADQSLLDAQEGKEIKALNQLFSLLPDEDADVYKTLWFEYEAAQTADGCFAKAIDCIQPLISNLNNQGQSWKEHTDVTKEKVLKRNEHLKRLAPRLWEYVNRELDKAVSVGWLKSEKQ